MACHLYVTNSYRGLEIWHGLMHPSFYAVVAWNTAGWPETLLVTDDQDLAESQAADWAWSGSVSIKKGNTLLGGPADGAAEQIGVLRD